MPTVLRHRLTLLVYSVAVTFILVATLRPADRAVFEGWSLCIICPRGGATEAVQNILLFVPFGIATSFGRLRSGVAVFSGSEVVCRLRGRGGGTAALLRIGSEASAKRIAASACGPATRVLRLAGVREAGPHASARRGLGSRTAQVERLRRQGDEAILVSLAPSDVYQHPSGIDQRPANGAPPATAVPGSRRSRKSISRPACGSRR